MPISFDFFYGIRQNLFSTYPYRELSNKPLANQIDDSPSDGYSMSDEEKGVNTKHEVLFLSSPTTTSSLSTGEFSLSRPTFFLACLARRLLIFFLPSFISTAWSGKKTRTSKLPPTAYLNGLRGIAAFCVWCQHFLTDYYQGEPLWGYGSRPEDVWVTQLPFIRLIYSGSFMVAIFFILSGFVLSHKPLQYVRSHEDSALLNNLASSVFRRGPRLFLPVIPPLVFAAFCVHGGVYGISQQPFSDEVVVSQHVSLYGDLRDAWGYLERLLNFFDSSQYFPPTVAPLYTLPIEFRGSILVFVLVLGLSKARPMMRMLTLGLLAYYAMYHRAWEMSLFIVGIIMAELRLIRNSSTFSLEQILPNGRLVGIARSGISCFWVTLLIIALYLGSWPITGSDETPGLITLSLSTPEVFQDIYGRSFFWSSIASILLLLSLENFTPLQTPFNTPIVQYLGDISFSLYVLHFPLMLTVGRSITVGLIGWTGDKLIGFCMGGVAMTPLLFWLSDVHWRLFDENSVKFARWLATRVFA